MKHQTKLNQCPRDSDVSGNFLAPSRAVFFEKEAEGSVNGAGTLPTGQMTAVLTPKFSANRIRMNERCTNGKSVDLRLLFFLFSYIVLLFYNYYSTIIIIITSVYILSFKLLFSLSFDVVCKYFFCNMNV